MKKIELRKITYSKALSEETSAYTADLYLDGKLLAHVSNRGHGGCDMQHPAKGRTYDEIKALNDEIKATYPKRDTGIVSEGKRFIMEQDLESVCGDLLDAHLIAKDLKRILARTVAFYVPAENAIRTYKGKNVGDAVAKLVELTTKKYPDAVVLNVVPFERAVELFKKAA